MFVKWMTVDRIDLHGAVSQVDVSTASNNHSRRDARENTTHLIKHRKQPSTSRPLTPVGTLIHPPSALSFPHIYTNNHPYPTPPPSLSLSPELQEYLWSFVSSWLSVIA